MADVTAVSSVTRRERRETERMFTARAQRQLTTDPQGSLIAPTDRLFGFFGDGTVFDYGQHNAEAIQRMLGENGQARSVEQVLTLPLRGASWRIDPPGADDGANHNAVPTDAQRPEGPDASVDDVTAGVRRNLGPLLPGIIDQMTTALSYTRAYFETTWMAQGGQCYYDKIEFRPATGCEAGFDPQSGKARGFRQRVVPVGGYNSVLDVTGKYPGFRVVTPQRAFIYTHGAYREPIMGVSDLDVSLWCWETKRKLMFLWFAFLENQALPKTVTYGNDQDEADERAEEMAELKSSGTMGLPHPPQGSKAFDILESAGQGAQQFYQAIQYLDSMETKAVLASFTDLPQAAVQGTGSYALSADQSEFFLASRQAVADEMADAITEGLIRPLVEMNYGPGTPCPRMVIGPLSSRYAQRALDMLTAVISSPSSNAPPEFVDQLVLTTSTYLGLDEAEMRNAIEALAQRREEQQKQQAEMAKAQAENLGAAHAAMTTQAGAKDTAAQAALLKAKNAAGPKMGSNKPGPTIPPQGKPAPPGGAKLGAGIDVARAAVAAKQGGQDPRKVLAAATSGKG